MDLCFSFFRRKPLKYVGWSIAPLQVKEEIEALLSILSKKVVCTMLEIGTAKGGTLFLFSKVANLNALIISLDLPGGKFGGGYGYDALFKIPFFKSFARGNQQINLVKANSHSVLSLSQVKSLLKGQALDFLFIDGDHTYEGVKRDFEMYSPLVRKGGLIALHDICEHLPMEGCEVHKFWVELKKDYEYKEIVSDPLDQRWAGIGIVYI